MRIYATLKSDGFEIVYNVPPDAAQQVYNWLKKLTCVTSVEVEDDE